ncbi:MAG: putative system TPR-repeat lipoprotein [Acidobacteria bacterium]|nr:putative system TPR-repeat lipoprotein [Acidobacteriota bacterium]
MPTPSLPAPGARVRPFAATLASACVLVAASSFAQTGANVLLVANGRAPGSISLAERYAARRGVPPDQLVRLDVDAADEIDYPGFERGIQSPVSAWLAARGAQDRILYIVLIKGVPLRIRGTAGRDGTAASVDSELALLYRRMAGTVAPLTGPTPNPYYLGDAAPAGAARFSRERQDIYLVTRLDGFTEQDVRALIDRGAAPSAAGQVLLDRKPPLDQPGVNGWLLESTSRPVSSEADVLGYASWGSNDPAIAERAPALRFVAGSLGTQFLSTDARTFTEPPPAWKPGPWGDRTKYYANSPQSLAGDLVRAGVSGVGAQVAEPYLDGTIRPQILFPAYFAGFDLAEAFYLATPYVSWQTVVIGDPLCAPFAGRPLDPAEADGGMDAELETPRYFASRRLAALARLGAAPAAAKALLRAEARLARKDTAGARQALEEATAADAGLRLAQTVLAELYQRAGEPQRAVERYRIVLAASPKDVASLNNLAYLLAVDLEQPDEALPYAERASTLAPGNAEVVDTYGWIQHLLGRRQDAVTALAGAVRLAPANALIRLHAAVAYAAAGMVDAASRELAEAIRLDPGMADREEARALKSQLK